MAAVEERVRGQAEEQGLNNFVELMQQVEELPEEQRVKVTYFTQGVLAAATNSCRKNLGNMQHSKDLQEMP